MNQPIVIIIADGWNRKTFNEYINEGYLPELSDFLKDSLLLENVLAVFPSVSLASHTSILTGNSQKKHGIICHRWLKNKIYVKNFVGIDTLSINNDISKSVKTIFEMNLRKGSYAIQSIISRGAEKRIKYTTFNSSKILNNATKLILSNPDSVNVIWLPSCDALSHKYGPYSKQVKREMITVSKAFGEMINVFKKNRIYDNSKILFTSDHGFKSVEKRFSLGKYINSLGYKTKVNSKKIINGVNIYTNGDSIALLNLNIINKTIKDIEFIAKELVTCEAIDFVVVKIRPEFFKIISNLGTANFIVNKNNTIKYKLESGIDPMGFAYDNKSLLINYKDLSFATINQKYPDFINQFLESFIPESDTDMVITSYKEYHFSKAPRLGYRFGFHRGSHGGATKEEMIFPAIIHSNNLKGKYKAPIRSKDLLEMLLYQSV